MDATTKHRLAAAARLGVTFGAGWLVFRNVDWISLAGLLHRADFTLLVLSSIPLAAQFATSVWRWQIILNLLSGVSVPIALLAITLGRSQLIGQYLPSTIGSDVVRAALLINRTGSAIAVRSVMCDRLVGLVIMVAMIVVMLPFFALFIDHGAAFVALAALSLGCLAPFIPFIARIDLLARIPWMGKSAVRVATDLRQTFQLWPRHFLCAVPFAGGSSFQRAPRLRAGTSSRDTDCGMAVPIDRAAGAAHCIVSVLARRLGGARRCFGRRFRPGRGEQRRWRCCVDLVRADRPDHRRYRRGGEAARARRRGRQAQDGAARLTASNPLSAAFISRILKKFGGAT